MKTRERPSLTNCSIVVARASAIVLTVALAGCVSSTAIVFNSYPPGATVFQNGAKVGPCPVTKRYAFTQEAKNKGTLDITGLKAEWPDGKVREIEKLSIHVPTASEVWFTGYVPVHYWNFHADLPTNTLPRQLTTTPTNPIVHNPQGTNTRTRLDDLKRLHEEGILTDEEYNKKRKAALDGL